MPKMSNIYQDKKSLKWYFVANLGYDEYGKRVRHWGRGYSTQKEAKQAYVFLSAFKEALQQRRQGL